MPKSGWKMRYAPHIGHPSVDKPLLPVGAGGIDPISQIRYIADLGFQGIEDNWAKLRPREDQERIGAELARLGLEMGCFVNTTGSGTDTLLCQDDNEARDVLKRELFDSIETAKRVNGRHMTTVCARDLRKQIGFQLVNMIENLKHLAEIAERAGVVLCLEQTAEPRLPGMLLHRIADAYAVVRGVGSPAVRLVLDILPLQLMEGNVIDHMRSVWDGIGPIQAADNPGRLEPGSGELNFSNIFRFIREQGYAGLIEFECELSKPGAAGEALFLERLRRIDDAI